MEEQNVLKKLAAPFLPHEIEWRAQGRVINNCVRVVPFITNRAIQKRLDQTFGLNWKNTYEPWRAGVLCGLSVFINNEWVTRYDGAEETKISSLKGALSDAMKRAAVQWGIGRYLYELPEFWVNVFPVRPKADRVFFVKDSQGNYMYWTPPDLPNWAVPEECCVVKKNEQPQQQKQELLEKFTQYVNLLRINEKSQHFLVSTFNLVNDTSYENAADIWGILEKSTTEQITNLFKAIAPVANVIRLLEIYKVEMAKLKEITMVICCREFKSFFELFGQLTIEQYYEIKKIVSNDFAKKVS